MRDTSVPEPERQPPRHRSDPLIPILASAVTLVCLGAVLLVFHPRLRAILDEGRDGVVRSVAPSDGKVPLWICRSEDGVALLLEPIDLSAAMTDARSAGMSDRALDTMLASGEHQYLRLSVYNFGRDEDYTLALPTSGFDSPEGGARLVPCASLFPKSITPVSQKLMVGLGAVSSLTVPRGQHARALLAASGKNLSNRTAFQSGSLSFERREVARIVLAAWHQEPALRAFLDF